MKTTYRIRSGSPSWHQARAGHTFAGEITLEHTPEEHAAFLAGLKSRGEPYHVTSLPPDDSPRIPETVLTEAQWKERRVTVARMADASLSYAEAVYDCTRDNYLIYAAESLKAGHVASYAVARCLASDDSLLSLARQYPGQFPEFMHAATGRELSRDLAD